MIVAVTGAIKGTSKEKFCDELGLESPQLRRWSRKLCYFYKFYRHETPQYLFQLIPLRRSSYTARNTENIPLFKTKHNFFKNSFSTSALIEWNSPDHNTRNVGSFSDFKNNILKLVRPTRNSAFNCKTHRGIKLITRLLVGVTHLREHILYWKKILRLKSYHEVFRFCGNLFSLMRQFLRFRGN